MPPPTPKDDWIAQFISELLVRNRPELGSKFARLIAIRSWPRCKGMAAEDAVRLWLESSKGEST